MKLNIEPLVKGKFRPLLQNKLEFVTGEQPFC